MVLVAILIGAILIVAAIRNTQGALFNALATDVPAFVVWAAAIIALGAIGYIPGLKPVSRGLLALVIIVIVLRQYQQIIAGFQGAVSSGASTGSASTGSASGSASAAPSVASSVSSVATPAPVPGNLNNLNLVVGPFGSIAGQTGIDFIEDTAPSGFANEALSQGY